MNEGYSVRYVPQARDGSCFTRKTCNKKGHYKVGEKGDEVRFNNYTDALAFLRQMSVAKWRRPNAKNNWGIVSAVEWIKADDQ